MDVPGLCAVCGRPALLHTCRTCGAHVCAEDYDPRHGQCGPCSTRRGIGVG